jgi:hypothetical protein
MKLYRPVNRKELQLIEDSGWTKFPPRLPEQPIFYPVLSLSYAKKINEWNIKDYGDGFIVEFEINNMFLVIYHYDVHNVGDKDDNEYWIKSEHLEKFNENIIGKIKCII